MTVTVRVAEPDDLERVGELTAQAYLTDALVDPDHWYVGELRDAARRAREATVLVAVDGDRVVGTITLAPAGSPYAEIAQQGEMELRMLAVDPAARGRGVGERLMRAAIERGLGWGAHAVVLSTMPEMRAAQRVYDRMGLRRAPERDWTGESGITFLTYVADQTTAGEHR
ncbi:MAG: GNAT family N-acetyltransferase [Actinomycetales bacterium]|nr:GNAT family N-acetyltransferase [Actinomycetales bacterium]